MDPIITSALTSFVTSVATNSSKVPMQTLDDLWYLAFGKLNHYVDKKKAEREVSLTNYKNSIAEKLQEVNLENLQEPPLSVVGPALEASKYYIEEEILRDMFANVIAASMNKTKSANVHHSFVEIIKQLSPEDAENIRLFNDSDIFPIVQIRKTSTEKGKGYKIIKNNVFHGKMSDIISGNENSASITNLQRLGLVSISFEENFIDKTRYDFYRSSSFFEELSNRNESKDYIIDLGEGIMRISPLGRLFVNVCA